MGSGLSHIYALAGGPVVPPSANAPDQQTIDRALLEIEVVAQSAVRAMSPPPQAPARRQERLAPPASTSPQPTTKPETAATEPATWQEPTSEAEAKVRRDRVSAVLTDADARLQVIKVAMAGTSGEERAILARERAKVIRDKSEAQVEQGRLKLWQAQNGFTATCGDKGPLWQALRRCHRLLERIAPEAPAFADDIEICLDAIEYVIPRRFLDEPEESKAS
ncbi:hypothetical protein [Sorangium sp. So ce388]|uniref:hypothetical protein n=1 Tax=Sorangium sp. So ce388 TaxID=3133309 RepID=UPI003F5B3F75